MASVPALADNERVTALIDRTIKLEIAGEVKTLPQGYDILTYDNRTYLPSRYVAEQLGCTVKWNEGSRWITISEPPTKEIEKIVEVPVEIEKPIYVDRDTNYVELPTSLTKNNIAMTLNSIHRTGTYSGRSGETKVSCRIKNNLSGDRIMVDYFNATLTVDEETLSVVSGWDQFYAYNDIDEQQTGDLTFTFPLVGAGTKNFIFQVPIRNQQNGDTTVMTIRFTATLRED